MAQWISACLFALSANIDNFPIGIAYGLRGMRIGAGGNLLIACLTSLGTAAAMLLGGGLARADPAGHGKCIGLHAAGPDGPVDAVPRGAGRNGSAGTAACGRRNAAGPAGKCRSCRRTDGEQYGAWRGCAHHRAFHCQNNSMHVRVQPDTSCGRRRCGQAVRRRASGQVCGSMLGGAHCGAGRLRTFYLTRLIPDNLPALSIDFPFLHRL